MSTPSVNNNCSFLLKQLEQMADIQNEAQSISTYLMSQLSLELGLPTGSSDMQSRNVYVQKLTGDLGQLEQKVVNVKQKMMSQANVTQKAETTVGEEKTVGKESFQTKELEDLSLDDDYASNIMDVLGQVPGTPLELTVGLRATPTKTKPHGGMGAKLYSVKLSLDTEYVTYHIDDHEKNTAFDVLFEIKTKTFSWPSSSDKQAIDLIETIDEAFASYIRSVNKYPMVGKGSQSIQVDEKYLVQFQI